LDIGELVVIHYRFTEKEDRAGYTGHSVRYSLVGNGKTNEKVDGKRILSMGIL
jgi:hypothetical protein